MNIDKKRSLASLFILTAIVLGVLFFNPILIKGAFASSYNRVCSGVYASNPIIYGLYLKARNKPISKSDIKTYIKIVDPALYMHDRHNPFLWHKLYFKDKAKLSKLMNFIDSVKYFKENIRASISDYNFKKYGFYLTYHMSDRVIENGMQTYRDINFVKVIHGNIYYLFHNLTIVHKNAGNLNFLEIPEDKAESFINKRTGTFGVIRKSVFLEYYFIPLKAKNNILTVKAVCVKVYNNKHKNLLIGIIK